MSYYVCVFLEVLTSHNFIFQIYVSNYFVFYLKLKRVLKFQIKLKFNFEFEKTTFLHREHLSPLFTARNTLILNTIDLSLHTKNIQNLPQWD